MSNSISANSQSNNILYRLTHLEKKIHRFMIKSLQLQLNTTADNFLTDFGACKLPFEENQRALVHTMDARTADCTVLCFERFTCILTGIYGDKEPIKVN